MNKTLTTITTIAVLIAAMIYIGKEWSKVIQRGEIARRIAQARVPVTQDILNELAKSFYEHQKTDPNANPNAELLDAFDGWGNKIEYYGNYTFRSAGADGVMDTPDDMHKNAMDYWSE